MTTRLGLLLSLVWPAPAVRLLLGVCPLLFLHCHWMLRVGPCGHSWTLLETVSGLRPS
jgi:hypothetical protein